jgi:type IV pilus assembly protein PilB
MSASVDFLHTLQQALPAHRKLLDVIAETHAGAPDRLLQETIDRGWLPHARACQLWADALGVAYVNPFNVELPSDPAGQLPQEVARRVCAVVVGFLAEGATVAMGDPADAAKIASLTKILGRPVSPVFAHPSEIGAVLDMHFGGEAVLAGNLAEVCQQWPALEGGREIRSAQDIADLVNTKAFAGLLNSVLLTAMKRKASDIHFEAGANDCPVRMRIDGDMTEIVRLPKPVHEAMIVRIKVLCSLDVSQARIPQDGSFEFNFGGRRPAFRASTMPGIYGEKGVLRLLGSLADQATPRLASLGLADSTRAGLRRCLLQPNGIMLVCGPTGSGKTTTLYACLGEVNRPDLNITTIEDPVEYRLPGVTQHPINPAVGLRFAEILRGVLRQDPDVILVGEIRDSETANIAAEAAMTGHLVLSSLHTNDSIQSIMRLVKLGVEPHLVGATLVGVLSQRLVRRICPACKESFTAAPEQLQPHFFNAEAEPVTLFRGRGCPQCFGSGYAGRVGVHSLLEISETMRDLILTGASPAELHEEAQRHGYRSMRHDGLKKALLGWTTLEEVERSTAPEMTRDAGPDATVRPR